MNVRTSMTFPSFRNQAVKALLLGSMALAASGFAMANDAVPLPPSSTYQTASQAKLMPEQPSGDAGNRANWNVDYPSQLAPQSVSATTGLRESKVASSPIPASRQP